MKKLLSLCILVLAASVTFAQEDWPVGDAVSQRYRNYRCANTEPAYGLKKIKAMVAKTKEGQDMGRKLSAKDYNSLTLEQKFTFTMIHGEDFTQNCSMMPPIEREEKKMFAFIPGLFNDEMLWSDRQVSFLKSNRATVIGLLRTTMRDRHRVGNNLKHAILELRAHELIPDLVTEYQRDRKDHDILTVLMLLMKEGKYRPFLASASYKKLYADEQSSYKAYLDANRANQQLVIDRATAFYRSRRK